MLTDWKNCEDLLYLFASINPNVMKLNPAHAIIIDNRTNLVVEVVADFLSDFWRYGSHSSLSGAESRHFLYSSGSGISII